MKRNEPLGTCVFHFVPKIIFCIFGIIHELYQLTYKNSIIGWVFTLSGCWIIQLQSSL